MKNLDQAAMCKLLHVSQPVYSRYENNEKTVNQCEDFVQRVAEEFEVTQEWLLNEEQNFSVVFEQGSISEGATGIGQVEHYYSVPKDFMDLFFKQQKMFEMLLEKFMGK